jgi:hypothetical protein
VVPRKRHLKMERLLTPAEVAELFKVNPLTVTRWGGTGPHRGRAHAGRLHQVEGSRGQAAVPRRNIRGAPAPPFIVIARLVWDATSSPKIAHY